MQIPVFMNFFDLCETLQDSIVTQCRTGKHMETDELKYILLTYMKIPYFHVCQDVYLRPYLNKLVKSNNKFKHS